MRRNSILAALLALLVLAPGAAAAERVRLHASLDPDRLGVATTIGFSLRISGTGHSRVPSPLRAIKLRFPSEMSLGSSTLGLAYCRPAPLLLDGLQSCSQNAVLGRGSGAVEVMTSEGIVSETATVTALLGPPNSRRVEVLFYAEGISPLFAQLVFPGVLVDDRRPYGTAIDTTIPLIATWPQGPDVSVTSFASTVGPKGLTYSERVRGKTVRFHPTGVRVPASCPRGGFPFAAELTFTDASKVTAKAAVPCPGRARRA